MVKKSSPGTTARDVAEALARGLSAGPGGFVPIAVSQADYDAWMAVEIAYAHKEEIGVAGAEKALRVRLGGADVMEALKVHKRVGGLLKRATAQTGRVAFPVPPAVAEIARPKLSAAEILNYAIERAIALGFAPAAILEKGQGRRGATGVALKRARERIVVELRDRGATQSDIGAVFDGRRKEAIYQIEKAGRHRRLEDIEQQRVLAERAKPTKGD